MYCNPSTVVNIGSHATFTGLQSLTSTNTSTGDQGVYTGEHQIITGSCSYNITSIQSDLPSNCSLELLSNERPNNVTDEHSLLMITACTGSYMYLKQKSGEVCAGYQCSHLCTGRQSLPLPSSHQTDQSVEEHHHSWPPSRSEPPLPAQEDFNNDNFSDFFFPEDDGWHNMNGGPQLAALLQPSEAESCYFETHSYVQEDFGHEVEMNHGDLHPYANFNNDTPETFYHSCVQETSPMRPGLQELVLSYSCKFWLCPRTSTTTPSTHSEHSIFDTGHLYIKPFVSHAP